MGRVGRGGTGLDLLSAGLLYEVLAFEHVGGYGFNGALGEDHGTNRKEHAADVDFVFQYGYWEADAEPTPRNPRHPRGS